MDPKQVIVVRKDLNMRKGKLAAQDLGLMDKELTLWDKNLINW